MSRRLLLFILFSLPLAALPVHASVVEPGGAIEEVEARPDAEYPVVRNRAQQGPSEEEDRLGVTVIRSRASETIRLDVRFPDEAEQVRISLFNLLGRLIVELPTESAGKGVKTFRIDSRDLTEGHYFVVVEALGQRVTKKVALFR